MSADSPTRMIYDESELYFSQISDASLHIPAVEACEGWQVNYMKPVQGLLPWCHQLKADLYELGLAQYWRDPAGVVELVEQEKWKK